MLKNGTKVSFFGGTSVGTITGFNGTFYRVYIYENGKHYHDWIDPAYVKAIVNSR